MNLVELITDSKYSNLLYLGEITPCSDLVNEILSIVNNQLILIYNDTTYYTKLDSKTYVTQDMIDWYESKYDLDSSSVNNKLLLSERLSYNVVYDTNTIRPGRTIYRWELDWSILDKWAEEFNLDFNMTTIMIESINLFDLVNNKCFKFIQFGNDRWFKLKVEITHDKR